MRNIWINNNATDMSDDEENAYKRAMKKLRLQRTVNYKRIMIRLDKRLG